MTPRRATIVAAGLALAGTLILPTAAGAHEGHEPGPRAERVCNRVPAVEARLDRALGRIDGDAETRGSLEWLAAKRTEAEADGRVHLVDIIDNRITSRTAARAFIVARQDEVADIAGLCADHGLGW
ncbi:MAG: hypothetical protein AAFN30_07945 [Actinomycetota bacterium]